MACDFVERQACPLCAARDSRLLVEIPYREARLSRFIESFYQGRVPLAQFGERTYRVVQCARCEFIYQDWILGDEGMQALYEEWVDQARSLAKKQQKQARLARQYQGQLHSIAQVFARPPAALKILEFGMGWGYWSLQAQAEGFDVTGLELSPRRRAHAQSMGVKTIEQLSGDIRFDCIYANQVFEHLPEPRRTMADLCACLNADGVIYLRVPDGRRIARMLASHGWLPEMDAIHPLEHINCFSRKTLIRLGRDCGLEPFSPPPRLNLKRLWGGIKRELTDRFITTHVFFRRRG